MINKILIPANPASFKQALLKSKRAKRTVIYQDQSKKVEMWNASKFTPSSDLMGNIDSQLWHRKDKAYIREVIYEIVDMQSDDALGDTEDVKVGELYIHYQKGWDSHEPAGEHMVEYVIENDRITIFYNVGFQKGRTQQKTITEFLG